MKRGTETLPGGPFRESDESPKSAETRLIRPLPDACAPRSPNLVVAKINHPRHLSKSFLDFGHDLCKFLLPESYRKAVDFATIGTKSKVQDVGKNV
jgi:hypothetical protein